MKHRVLIVRLNDLARDPRVEHQIDFLLPEFDVVVAGLAPPNREVEYLQLDPAPPQTREAGDAPVQESGPEPGPPRSFGYRAVRFGILASRYALQVAVAYSRIALARLRAATFRWRRILSPYPRNYWLDPRFAHWMSQIGDVAADVILVNDAIFLPAGLALAGSRPVVFDALEYAPSEMSLDRRWRIENGRLLTAICRREMPRAAATMTVSPGLARAYLDLTGVHATVVTNAPPYADLRPTPVDTEQVRLVHWGGADPQRRLELMIDMMRILGNGYLLDLLLVPGDEAYISHLTGMARSVPTIRVLPPVPMSELPQFGNDYDIGVFLLPAQHVNQEFALPNKFFEFVQARLAVAIGPSPDMVDLANLWDIGIVSKDFTAAGMAAAIRETSPNRLAELKEHSDRAATELCAERNAELVRDVVRRAALKNPKG